MSHPDVRTHERESNCDGLPEQHSCVHLIDACTDLCAHGLAGRTPNCCVLTYACACGLTEASAKSFGLSSGRKQLLTGPCHRSPWSGKGEARRRSVPTATCRCNATHWDKEVRTKFCAHVPRNSERTQPYALSEFRLIATVRSGRN